MRVFLTLCRLSPIAVMLVLGGCYAALGGTVSSPISDTNVGTTQSPELDLGVIADFGDSQVFAAGRVGGVIIGNRLNDLVGEDRSRASAGGVVGFMVQQEPAKGERFGWDWQVALSYASLMPQNSDLEKPGTLLSIMIGPYFNGGKSLEEDPLKRLRGGITSGIAISRLDLLEETTWSIGFSFKFALWMDKEWGKR